MEAAEHGHLEVVKLLLDNGAKLNTKREYGVTALKVARKKGHNTIVELLKSRGAKD